MKETKPIKRSQQLAPLSREHHDALVFLLRIKQGLKNGTDPTILCDYIHWFWNNNLKDHFDHEEELLLPQLPTDDQLAIQLKNEHQTIRSLISKDLDKDQIVPFTDLLNAHIRFEERELFPHIERKVAMQVLNEIFKKLDQPVQCQTSWKIKFW
jgi:hemerythrin-like domain-containing protein